MQHLYKMEFKMWAGLMSEQNGFSNDLLGFSFFPYNEQE